MELFDLWAGQYQLDSQIFGAITLANQRLSEAAAVMDEATESQVPGGVDGAVVRWRDEPGVAGFWGFGLWLPKRGGPPQPTAFVDQALAPVEGRPVATDEETVSRMRALGMTFDPMSIGLWMVGRGSPTPQHCAPGQTVTVPGRSATLGCRVTLSNGRVAISTAGHGARTTNLIADVAGTRIGRVAHSVCPQTQTPGTPCADIALIALDRNHQEGAHRAFQAYQATSAGDDLLVNVPAGTQQAWARAVLPTLWLNRTCGAWANVIETDHHVSVQGDSGSTVEVGTTVGHPTGHVVAGDAVRTVIQDLDYQLGWFNAAIRP
ncbi:hypothetical protein [Kitasatospora sp. NPDC093558]|uniref:hypothetical protein n=1 Tax=Kitasatospora sp. NPDC093558 TaxID=3155201 RepID=UPI00341C8F0A